MSNPTSNLVAAARELLRLKDLKTDAQAIETSGSWSAVHRRDAMLAEHEAKKGAAWDALRRALHEPPVETPAPQRKYFGIGHLEETGYIPAGSAAEREGVCQDCPPVGYPTDDTRCTPCPRRAVKTGSGGNG